MAELKTYIITTACPVVPASIKSQGPAVGEPWRRAAYRDTLTALSTSIQQRVLNEHGGEIMKDGSGYGREGDADQFVDVIVLKTTDAGVEALKRVDGVNRISEGIDFGDGKTPFMVPEGLCWSRHP